MTLLMNNINWLLSIRRDALNSEYLLIYYGVCVGNICKNCIFLIYSFVNNLYNSSCKNFGNYISNNQLIVVDKVYRAKKKLYVLHDYFEAFNKQR